MQSLKLSCCALMLCLGAGYAQTFEVASVKPAGPLDPAKIMSGQMRIGKKVDKARVEYSSMSLDALIMDAYKVKSFQVVGPDWMSGMSAPRFDIQAKMPEGATEEQIPQMLQALLAERFGLKIHKDSKEKNIYAMVVAKTGLLMKPAEALPDTPEEPNQPAFKMSGNMQDGKGMTVNAGRNGTTKVNMSPDMKTMHMEISKAPMTALVEILTRMVDRPVVDMTDLKGDYQIALDLPLSTMMAMAGAMGGGPPPGMGADGGNKMAEASDPGTSIFESVQKLGLKLEPRKGPVETIVVDHLEKTPSEN
ncbi:MAG TPA: TIGR03435 family protein [Candidatus Sulfopaludibacter sp.]|jgi:uncharacterized protein (TIGR03435 family)|nr:TIGR03435 family protein [Candidatus Sulfopaludibacter sp.]